METAEVENYDQNVDFGKSCILECKCPKCGKIFKKRFKYGYFGSIKGPLYYHCKGCKQVIDDIGSVEDDVFVLIY